nr:retrovirus-related Pol polyprotein from transposon TNT 1-94 [Tanacetum cinerariifolium]
MFDEYFHPPPCAISPVPEAAMPRAIDLADSPVSTSTDQDSPSTSIPSTQEQEHSLIISQCVEESVRTPHFHDDLLHESLYEDSTSQGLSSNVRPSNISFVLTGAVDPQLFIRKAGSDLLLDTGMSIIAYADADHAGCQDTRRSTSGSSQFLGNLIFQIENKDQKKQENMYYPRFTKTIIHHFITKDKSISIGNRVSMQTAKDDSILGSMRFVSSITQDEKENKETCFSFKEENSWKSTNTSEGIGLKPGVLDMSTTDSSNSENESWDDSGDKDEEQSDDERTNMFTTNSSNSENSSYT